MIHLVGCKRQCGLRSANNRENWGISVSSCRSKDGIVGNRIECLGEVQGTGRNAGTGGVVMTEK